MVNTFSLQRAMLEQLQQPPLQTQYSPCASASDHSLRTSELTAGYSLALEAYLEEYFKKKLCQILFLRSTDSRIKHRDSEEYLHGACCKLHCTAS